MMGRNTQGVRLIRLDEGERLVGIVAVSRAIGGDDAAADAPSRSTADPVPNERVRVFNFSAGPATLPEPC